MRRYRVAPVSLVRSDDDEEYLVNEMGRAITVYEREEPWEKLPLIDPSTGRPIEVYVGPEPIGFLHFEDE